MAAILRSRFWPALLGLWLLTLLLALIQLGAVPLRDWDEGIVARVALELSQRSWPDVLLPTYLGEPYRNKPPGLHLLIAGVIQLWRLGSGSHDRLLPPEGVIRLAPALLSSLLVPLLALVQRRLRPEEPRAALATALVTVTLLPLARQGRLAMLDGSQLSAMALVWLGLLLASEQQCRSRWLGGIGAGLGTSALLLLKAPVAPAALAVALTLRWLDRDLSRRAWAALLGGLVLGLLPGLAWHGWHGLIRGNDALVMWGEQGVARLTGTVENHDGGPLVPLLQVVQGGWPWLPLWPGALRLAWQQRQKRSGRWVLGLTLASLLLVLPLNTQLPWYSLLIWPPFALACGPRLAQLWPEAGTPRPGAHHLGRAIGLLWLGLGGGALALAALSLASPAPAMAPPAPLGPMLMAAGLGLVAGSGLALAPPGSVRQRWAIPALATGWCAALALLFCSPSWNWELNEQTVLDRELMAGRPLPGVLVARKRDLRRPSYVWYANPAPGELRSTQETGDLEPFELIQRRDDPPLAPPLSCDLRAMGLNGWQRWRCRR